MKTHASASCVLILAISFFECESQIPQRTIFQLPPPYVSAAVHGGDVIHDTKSTRSPGVPEKNELQGARNLSFQILQKHILTYIHTYIHPSIHPPIHTAVHRSASASFSGQQSKSFCIACFEIFECGCACKQDKHCYIPLLRKWYDQIRKGEKQFEMRAASSYWQSRVHGATHVVFSNGSLLECMHEQSAFRLAPAVF